MRRQRPWVHERIDATSLNVVAVDAEECPYTVRQGKR